MTQIDIDLGRRPMSDREMDLALSESGFGPVRYREVNQPLRTMPYEPAWYEAARSTPMCGIPNDADRPDRGMQDLSGAMVAGAALTALIAFVATR